MANISHDRYFLDRAVNKIFELEDGGIAIYHTAYTGFLEEKRSRSGGAARGDITALALKRNHGLYTFR